MQLPQAKLHYQSSLKTPEVQFKQEVGLTRQPQDFFLTSKTLLWNKLMEPKCLEQVLVV